VAVLLSIEVLGGTAEAAFLSIGTTRVLSNLSLWGPALLGAENSVGAENEGSSNSRGDDRQCWWYISSMREGDDVP